MAESLAAIGLAGNVVQFISFSSALISKTREFHQSASGVSAELVDLGIVARDIKRFNSHFFNNANASSQLSHVARCCDAVAQELLGAILGIQKETQSSNKTPSKWRSFRKALKSVWKKEQIEELKSRLVLLRDQLLLHLASDTSDKQANLFQLLEEWRKENVDTDYQITNQIQALDAQLRDCQQHISRISDDRDWTKLCHEFSKMIN